MNQEELDILCCPQDSNTNKFSQFNFALFRSFWYIFPHEIIISKQPSIGRNWIHFKLVRSVFFAVAVRLECSTQNMHQITRENSFSHFLFLQKAKGRHLIPNGLSCAHAQGCHVTHSSGRRTTVLKIAPNFTAVELDDIPTDHFYHQKMLSIFICLHISTLLFCILY